MKIKPTETSLLSTNATAIRTIKMRVDDVGLVMKYMATLYPNPIQTLTQEYLSNGRDATRSAKNKKPLIVTLPNDKTPTLKIRDYGTGLSEQRVQEVFVVYGKSTKTGTNNQTGGFGIGGKSAWSYTDNFTIISYLDGVARHYVALADGGDGVGELRLQAQVDTAEQNGIEIQIAVKAEDTCKFVSAVERATMFWETKPIFHGETISYNDPILVAGNVEFYGQCEGLHQGCVYLAVDGIPYEISASKYSDLQEFKEFRARTVEVRHRGDSGKFKHAVLHCGNGDVEIALNRESLQDSEATTAGIKAILAEGIKSIDAHGTKELRDAETLQEFLKLHDRARYFFKFSQDETFLDKDGDKFIINKDGLIVSGIPATLKFTRLSKEGRRKLEIEDTTPDKISLQGLYFADAKISKNGLQLRMKDRMRESSDSSQWTKKYEECFVAPANEDYKDAEYLRWAEKLGARNVYDIQVDKAPLKDRKTDDTEVLVNYLTGDKYNHKTYSCKIDLETNKELHVYILKSSETHTATLSKFFNFNDVCKVKLNVKVCFIPPNREKKVKGYDSFVSLENFFKNLPKYVDSATWDSMQVAARRGATYSIRSSFHHLINRAPWIEALNQLEDRESAALFATTSTTSSNHEADSFVETESGLAAAVGALVPDVAATQAEVERVYERIRLDYPMMLNLNFHNFAIEDIVKELVWYMNAKFREKQKT